MAMTEHGPLTRENLKSHRAAAIAGILFSIILILVFGLLRISVPDDPQEPGSWLKSESSTVALAVNLVPFAGIAFLWFIGVLRDRLYSILRQRIVVFGNAVCGSRSSRRAYHLI